MLAARAGALIGRRRGVSPNMIERSGADSEPLAALGLKIFPNSSGRVARIGFHSCSEKLPRPSHLDIVVWVLVVRLGRRRLTNKPPPIFSWGKNLVGIKYLLDQRPRFRAIFRLTLSQWFLRG